MRPVLARVVQVEVHLTGVRVGESAQFEVDDHEAPNAPVKEQEVHSVPGIIDSQTPLTSMAALFRESAVRSQN